MSNEKFTKAPWYIASGKTYCCIRNDERVIADMRTVNAVYNEHDANLLVTALEMYEMLNIFVQLAEDDRSEDFLYKFNEIKELLAKARGEK